VTAETLVQPTPAPTEARADAVVDRRADIDAKMLRVADLLKEVGCDGLLLLEPENFSWLSSGGMDRGVPDPASAPAVYCTPDARWLVASNADSQRLFDEEIDGLGFQLKEWPWHWGREQFLADLCQNRKLACDRPREGTVLVDEQLRRLRRCLTPYEQACQRSLGQIVAHALEATCRTLAVNESEREIAGQLSHRLLHRGTLPLYIGVAVDGRSRLYRHFGFTSVTLRQYAVLSVTARKYGLTVSASRSVCFGDLPADFRAEHNAVCRVSASYQASSWPDAVPREVLLAARRIYLISGFEHEWSIAPQGHLTGRACVELPMSPHTEDLLQAGWSVAWSPNAGAARACDTFLITDQGPRIITAPEVWPQKGIRFQGAEFACPDVLQR
jgi:Xaa-Pro dipeptidase